MLVGERDVISSIVVIVDENLEYGRKSIKYYYLKKKLTFQLHLMV